MFADFSMMTAAVALKGTSDINGLAIKHFMGVFSLTFSIKAALPLRTNGHHCAKNLTRLLRSCVILVQFIGFYLCSQGSNCPGAE
jgi:hypothetical protein